MTLVSLREEVWRTYLRLVVNVFLSGRGSRVNGPVLDGEEASLVGVKGGLLSRNAGSGVLLGEEADFSGDYQCLWLLLAID